PVSSVSQSLARGTSDIYTLPYTTLFRSAGRARIEIDDRPLVLRLQQVGPGLRHVLHQLGVDDEGDRERMDGEPAPLRLAEHVRQDRKSTRLNSSHVKISYAVFCLKKKKL